MNTVVKLNALNLNELDFDDLTDEDFPELEGEHVSAIERFEDGTFEKISWDAEMAFRLLKVDPAWPRQEQLAVFQDAINEGHLPDEAVERLIDYGFTELG
jgi:hypothetical protein